MKSGLTWVLLSPLALLMALISTVESLTVYYIQIALFGTWAACGVVAGLAGMASAPWSGRLKVVLLWIAFGYFFVCAVLIAVYTVLLIFSLEPGPWRVGLSFAAVVFLTGVPFLYFARRRKLLEDREQKGQRLSEHRVSGRGHR
ncbi:MAG: hypothetical protein HY207_07790 [Nitrospirae bacterium]|nr:hypothetical protein [Nitrospirota bacterium]